MQLVKRKSWGTTDILELCDKRIELRKKKLESEGSVKYREVNNSIKRYMRKRLKKTGWRTVY